MWKGGGRNPADPASLASARAEMVAQQLRARGIRDERVLGAMGSVPRERFVSPDLADRAYADAALPAALGQTISQPLMVALMTELLAVEPGVRVLEIGTGTGYQAAVLAAIGCRVTSIERLADLAAAARQRLSALGYAEVVKVLVGDGSLGSPGGGPWERIIVTAGAPRIPEALVAQLADGGRLVIPVGSRYAQDLVLVERTGEGTGTTSHGPCVFVPLVGADGWG
jgi:protein-L-isoaspartate(D-aspartate) O-methyltransferase